MATRLFFTRDVATTQHWGGSEPGLSEVTLDPDPQDWGQKGGWCSGKLDTIRGVSVHTLPRLSIEGPHDGIECINSVSGWSPSGTSRSPITGAIQWVQWFTEAIDVGGTISSGATIPVNLWGNVSAVSANAALGLILEKFNPNDGSYTLIGKSSNTAELTATTAGYSFNITAVANVTLAKGDRIRARVFFDDAGSAGLTTPSFVATGTLAAVAAGGSVTLSVGLPAGATYGDVLIMQAWHRGATGTLATPDGWVKLGEVASSTARHYWFARHWENSATPILAMPNTKYEARVVPGTSGGWTLTHNGNTTTSLFGNATATTVANALAALPSIGSGNVIVRGGYTQEPHPTLGGNYWPWFIEFVGTLAGADQTLTIAHTFTPTGSADLTKTQSGSPVNGDRFAMISAYRNSHGVKVIGTPEAGAQAARTAPGITTLTDQTLIVVPTNGEDNNAASTTYAATSPASLTQDNYQESAIGSDGACAIGSAVKTTAGATGTVTATWSALPVATAAIVLGLKPGIGNEMAPSHQLLFAYNGGTALANGDSWFDLPIDVTFLDPLATTKTTWWTFSQWQNTGGASPNGYHLMRESDWAEMGLRTTDSYYAGPNFMSEEGDGPIEPVPFGDGFWTSADLPADLTLSGYVRIKQEGDLLFSNCGFGAMAQLSYWDEGSSSYIVWARAQMSPQHSYGQGSAIGYLSTSQWTHLNQACWFFLAAPTVIVPEGSHLKYEIFADDSYRGAMQRHTLTSPSFAGQPSALLRFRYNGGNNGVNNESILEFTNDLYVPALDQARLRGRNDDGDETTATWKAATNVGWEQPFDENFRVRVSIDEVGNADPDATGYKLQANWDGGSYVDVTPSSTGVKIVASPNVADGTATTVQLGPALDGGPFVAGQFDEGDGAVASNDIALAGHTEHEWSLMIPSGGDVPFEAEVRFRAVMSDGTPLARYGGNPVITTPAEETPPPPPAAGPAPKMQFRAHITRRD